MNVNPGELNRRISFYGAVDGTDTDGFTKPKDSIIHSCWAKVTNMSGTETIKSGKDFAEINTRFLIRYTSKNLNSNMEILFDNRKYDISYINDYGFSHEYIEVFAKVRE